MAGREAVVQDEVDPSVDVTERVALEGLAAFGWLHRQVPARVRLAKLPTDDAVLELDEAENVPANLIAHATEEVRDRVLAWRAEQEKGVLQQAVVDVDEKAHGEVAVEVNGGEVKGTEAGAHVEEIHEVLERRLWGEGKRHREQLLCENGEGLKAPCVGLRRPSGGAFTPSQAPSAVWRGEVKPNLRAGVGRLSPVSCPSRGLPEFAKLCLDGFEVRVVEPHPPGVQHHSPVTPVAPRHPSPLPGLKDKILPRVRRCILVECAGVAAEDGGLDIGLEVGPVAGAVESKIVNPSRGV
mmetsp:Transcript_16887/g.33753  ORF Transcript_16887/g.33753 Transcript_16887/m.33753 type:complete len:296 (-) Transcript_16887:2966-3853(-)